MFSQVFFMNESGLVDQHNNIIARVISALKESLELLNINEETPFVWDSKNISNKSFNQDFENIGQLNQFVQIIALKATTLRKQYLLKCSSFPLNNQMTHIFQRIKKILDVKGCFFTLEEFAFVESLAIFLICLTQLNQNSQDQG